MTYLSFLYIDDNGNGLINGEASLSFDLPKQWNVADIERLVLQICIDRDIDYVSEENIHKLIVEAVKAYHERRQKPKKQDHSKSTGAKKAKNEKTNEESIDDTEDDSQKKPKISPTTILYRLGIANIEQKFRDIDNREAYAVCQIEGRKKILDMDGSDFSSFLRRLYEDDFNYQESLRIKIDKMSEVEDGLSYDEKSELINLKTTYKKLDKHDQVPSETHLKNAIDQLKAHITEERSLGLRLVWDRTNKIIYYNLANKNGDIVKITADKDGNGWEIVNNNDLLLFKQLRSTAEQVTPSKTFDPNKRYLKDIIAHIDFTEDHHRIIDEIYHACLMLPGISQPVYTPNGEEGSGKSSLQLVKKSSVDPNENRNGYGTWSERMTKNFSTLRTDYNAKPWDRALVIESNYITYADNMSSVTNDFMDELCKWCSPGFHDEKEAKYKNKEMLEISGKRPVGLNGINNLITAGDLNSRVFAPTLRKSMAPILLEKVLDNFQKIKSEIVGYLCHLTSKFLYYYSEEAQQEIEKKLETRLDFEIYGEIMSRCMGNNKDEFLDAWAANRNDQTEATISSSTLARAVVDYMNAFIEREKANGSDVNSIAQTPEQLLIELKNMALTAGVTEKELMMDTTWPKNAVHITRKLNLLKGSLSHEGIIVMPSEKINGKRKICIVKGETQKHGIESYAQ